MERKSLLPLIKNVNNIVNETKRVIRENTYGHAKSNRGIFSDGALDRVKGIVSRREENNAGNRKVAENEGFEPGE